MIDISKNILETIYIKYQSQLNRRSHTETELQDTIGSIFQIGTRDSIIWFFENKPSQFNIRFLLCFPEIWNNFNYADWCYISDNLNRPNNPKYLMQDYGHFDDFIFLYNYANVNWQEYILFKSKIKKENKESILSYINIIISDMKKKYPNPNFKGYGDISYLHSIKNKLILAGISPVQEVNKYKKIEILS